MKKIKAISLLILFLVVLHSISAEAILGPSMGMMYTHNLATTDAAYQGLIKNNKNLNYDNLAIAIATSEKLDQYDDSFDWNRFRISIKSDDNMLMFVSDDNPVYKRPFEIYLLQRGAKVIEADSARNDVRQITEIETNTDTFFPKDDRDFTDWGHYRWVWCDVVLQLPGTPAADGGGVVVDNIFYPLIQGTYSARFDIEFEDTKTGEVSRLPVVIPGIYDASLASTSSNTRASIAFSITPDPSAVNLNIEQLVRNKNLQRVGSIDSLWREEGFPDSGELDDGAGAYIFLSASPDSFTPEPDGFKLVHEDFVEGETAYSDINSIDYYVVLSGNSEHAGLGETFYGEDCFPSGATEATKWVKTQCHKQSQPQQDGYAHYHTYTGDISIRVEGNPDVTMLAKGQYSSTIYVHVVAEDIQ